MNLSTFDLFRTIDDKAAGLITLSQEQLDQLQKVLITIADDMMEVCEENDIMCFICGGTALGAYREGKFIPWDDDLDMIMPRADYNKFVVLFKERYGDKYWIHTPEETENFGFQVAHIRKKGTKVKTKSDLYDDTEAGANVDIFIAENTFDNSVMRVLHGYLCMFMGLMLSCRRFYRDREALLKLVGYSAEKQRIFKTKIMIGRLLSIFSVNTWTRMTNGVCSLCKNNNSRYVAIPSGRKHYFGEMYVRNQFCVKRPILFEGRQWYVPGNVEEYFELLYGKGYMEVPPPEKREKHICWAFELNNDK